MSDDISANHVESLSRLCEVFAKLPDVRQPGKVSHPLGEVLACAFCSMICGYSTFTGMGTFAESQLSWLRKFLKLERGAPSHDTFRNVFTALNPDAFAAALAAWAGDLYGKHLAIDGKTIRGTGVHMLRAWVDDISISAGQVACEKHSNEIKAIPRLLDGLALRGTTVSIDAIGCQTEIASQIDAAGGRYLLALKGNQHDAHKVVRDHFEKTEDLASARSEEFVRGRHEVRTCVVEHDLGFFGKSWKWAGLTCVVRVCAEVCRSGELGTDGAEATKEDRFYLCSLPPEEATAEALLNLVRAHWSVENRCHWTLDVVFGEDACPVRDKIAARNLSTMRGMVMHLLRNDPVKGSLKSKQQRAALDPSYRTKLISKLHP